MNFLFIGDIVGDAGCQFMAKSLPNIKKNYKIDFCIANGENSAVGNGITPISADFLFNNGIDIITSGNHVWQKHQIYDYIDDNERLIRPANYKPEAPGKGYCIYNAGRYNICVINLMGTVFLEPLKCPFETIDQILSEIKDKADIIIVDFHAEATSEKRAFGYYVDGRVSAVIGTHTHVQTADEQILPQGTAYITDAGMTGALYSVLGVKVENAIEKLKTHMPVQFKQADGDCMLNGVVINIDEKTNKCLKIDRIIIK